MNTTNVATATENTTVVANNEIKIGRVRAKNSILTLFGEIQGNTVCFKVHCAYGKNRRSDGPDVILSPREASDAIIAELKTINYRDKKSQELTEFLLPIWQEASHKIKALQPSSSSSTTSKKSKATGNYKSGI